MAENGVGTAQIRAETLRREQDLIELRSCQKFHPLRRMEQSP
jgi:hypothetical protein